MGHIKTDQKVISEDAVDFPMRLFAPFGVELDLDLSAPLSPAQQARFRSLFFQHGLVLARNQRLSLNDQMRLAGHIAQPVSDGDAHYLSNKRPDDPFGSEAISYHADNMYSPYPHVGISLHAVDVVDNATSTQFASAVRAAACMPDPLRQRVQDRQGLLITTTNLSGRNRLVDQPIIPGTNWPQALRPVIWRHPITGVPFVAVNYNNADSIAGLPVEESEELLAEIFAVLYATENVYEHRWHNGDVIFWDNYALQHARPAVSGSQTRTLQRVTFGGKGFGEMYPEIYEFYRHRSLPHAEDLAE